MEGLPPLNLSSGPSISDAQSGGGAVGTGAFNFKPRAGLIESIAPWVALGVVAWLVLKK
tara:strand:+ start:516 stop:692 length:177 start_codon:yes stop_codon:yes gene_type:complete